MNYSRTVKKLPFILLLLLFVYMHNTAQTKRQATSMDHFACDSAAANMRGQFLKVSDEDFYGLDKNMEREMSKRLDEVMKLVRETFPGPRGFEAWYYRGTTGNEDKPYVPNGPKYYRLTIPFFPFHCGLVKDSATHMKELLSGNMSAGDETGTWMYISFNNPAWLAGRGENMLLDGKNHKVYEMSTSLVDYWKGFPITGGGIVLTGSYIWEENEGFGNNDGVTNPSIYILVTRKNENAFLPISRKQYLNGLLDKYEKIYQKDSAQRAKNVNYYQQQMDNDKQLMEKGDNRARVALKGDQDMQKKFMSDRKPEDTYNAAKKNVENYLSTAPEDSLKLPARIYGYTDNKHCADWFRPDPKSNSLPVTFVTTNFQYWRTGQNRAAPQMIALRFRFENTNWHSIQIKKQFENNFPIEKLQAMLDK